MAPSELVVVDAYDISEARVPRCLAERRKQGVFGCRGSGEGYGEIHHRDPADRSSDQDAGESCNITRVQVESSRVTGDHKCTLAVLTDSDEVSII